MTAAIYHNPKCSKSRQTLALLREKGIEARIIEYLKTPPSATEHPALIERPIVLANGKAALGRPSEAALAVL